MKKLSLILLFTLFVSIVIAEIPSAWPLETLMGVELLESSNGEFPPCADILSCYFNAQSNRIRLRLPMMTNFITGENEFSSYNCGVQIEIAYSGALSDGVL
jgi:hypothetical protein